VDEAGDASIEPADPDVEGHPDDGEPGGPGGSAEKEGSGEDAEDADEIDPEVLGVMGREDIAVVIGESDDIDHEIEPADEGDSERAPCHRGCQCSARI